MVSLQLGLLKVVLDPDPDAHLSVRLRPITLLFSSLSQCKLVLFLLPTVLASLLAGGIAPFMTQFIGAQIDTFATYHLRMPTPTTSTRFSVALALPPSNSLASCAALLSSAT
jgi:hypothetical protein